MLTIKSNKDGTYTVYDTDGIVIDFPNYKELSKFIRENNIMDTTVVADWSDEFRKFTGK
jgi:hypothetical protein